MIPVLVGFPAIAAGILMSSILHLGKFIVLKLMKDRLNRKTEAAKAKLLTIDQKENFKEFTLVQRELDMIKKQAPSKNIPNIVFRVLGMLIPFICYKCTICSVPNHVLSPISKMAAFPHKEDNLVGFSFYWGLIHSLIGHFFQTLFSR